MAPRKQAKKKTAKKNKGVGLFDHIDAVKTKQDPHYFDKLDEPDKKTWSNWMILRALSYNDDYLPIVNEIQRYMHLPPHLMYRLLIDIFPKQKTFDKFLRGAGEGKYEEWLIDLVKTDLQVSKREARHYLDIFMLTDEGKSAILELCESHGVEPKEIKKLKL
jgi:hypothetical protein